MNLRGSEKRLQKLLANLPSELSDIMRGATLRAVETATDLTPTTGRYLAGTNTRSGKMKQQWAKDSKTQPQISGTNIITTLENSQEYASYVNDGHRMDRHFVPGLYVNPATGQLEYDPTADVGVVVGTRTQYVQGLFMVDKAKREYKKVLREEAKRLEGMLDK